ncbi:Transferase [Parasponia andersonii]|uniref:Transferase n=1 Tax=Parasponia andersonii TaxID=3476 RepID=A0A2P5AT43_PARAD|nr:Transferase [Parasponia andersonii]
MKIEVELISKEIVKPSSPTPNHLRHYQLSFLDQLCPNTYNPLVFFYELHDHYDISEISNKIKKSLSEVLTLYYPLAGRVKNDRFVDCNDEGVSYTVARVNSTCRLSDAIKNPLPSELSKFLPFELLPTTEFALGVQLNIFEHGGIAIGLCILHKLGDALSCVVFAKTWVAVARGEANQLAHPEFVSAALFPFKDDHVFDPTPMATKKTITKRFVFDASTIEAIRLDYNYKDHDDQPKRPSRVEALSTFIWNRFVAATKDEYLAECDRGYTVVHPANLRPRLIPPLPEHSFGNLARCGVVILSNGEEKGSELVKLIREGMRKLDMDYLRKVQQGEDEYMDLLLNYSREITMKGGQYFTLCFTSLCRFPLYDTDFGWGQPTWVSSAALCFGNFVAFMDTKSGNGIEAYISLKEEHMAKLEADENFLKAASLVAAS